MIKIVFFILVLILLSVAYIYTFYLFIWLILTRGVPFVPLSKKQLKTISVNIKLNPEDKVVDLGCGDGRVLRIFEKQGVQDLTGYEMNFWIYLLARIENKILKSKAKIYFKNFQRVNLSEYNIVFCYLSGYYMNSLLKEKFDRELMPGTKIISYVFSIKNWRKPEIISGKIFVYTIE